jgi:bifunctional ADP-heptose synthase (sugar kinase/adenylyltransferase)
MDTQQQKQFKILVIGDSCVDIYHYGECTRISPEAPVPIFKHEKSEKYGGMASNVANNLIGLENIVDIITNKEKITKERFIEIQSMHHLLRADTGESKKLPPISLEEIEEIDFKDYDAVVISDYDKGFLQEDEISQIVFTAKRFSLDIFVDSKKRDLSVFENCILKINEHETRDAMSFPNQYELIVTMGKNGALWRGEIFPPNRSEIDDLDYLNIKSLRSTNVCGAGDTFLSGLVSEYLRSKDMKKSIEFANLCGSKAIENFGTYVVSLRDLK